MKLKKLLIMLLTCLLVIQYIPMVDALAAEDYRGWSQSDSRWGSLIMGDDRAATVSGYGCASVSMAKILRQCGAVSESYTPKDFVNYMNKIGNYVMLPSSDSGSIASWANTVKAGTGISYEGTLKDKSYANMMNYVKNGYYLIVGGSTSRGGHYCAVDNALTLKNGYITVMNSWSTSSNVNVKCQSLFTSISQVVVFKSTNKVTPYANVAGTYYLKNNATGTYMTVDGGKDADKTNVSVTGYLGTNAQKMAISWNGVSSTIRPLCSSTRLINPFADTVKAGINVNIYKTSNDGTQNWGFEAVDGGYVIRNMANKSCVLSVSGTNVLVETYTAGAAKQIWSLVVDANGVTLADSTVDLEKGNTYVLLANVSPINALDKTVNWSTDNEKVATVAADGTVTAVGAGTATITASTTNGYTASCIVNVKVTNLKTPAISSVKNVVNGVKIAWGAVDGAEKYRVYRKTGTESWKKIKDTTSLSYVDKKAESGVEYTYTVRCVSADGSKTMSSYNKTGKTIVFLATPVLESAANNVSGVKVSWGAVSGAGKYRVYRKTGTGSWAKVADTTSISYIDKTAISGTEYVYTVRSISGADSNILSAYDTIGKNVKYIAAPIIKDISNISVGVSISWDNIKGASNYRVYRKTGTGSWTKLADTKANAFVDTTAKKGVAYSYTVRCINADGSSCISAYDTKGKTITFK